MRLLRIRYEKTYQLVLAEFWKNHNVDTWFTRLEWETQGGE